MRTITKLGGLTAITALTAGLLAGPAAAARSHPVLYLGVAGGSKVTLLDGTVTSGYTAPSTVQGSTVPNSAHNSIATAAIPDLLSAGVITTNESVAAAGATGTSLTSHAETADVDLLGGLITADAVDTTSTTTFTGTDFTSESNTQFVNLQISGFTLPVDIPRNFTVKIPGVARIVLNYAASSRNASTMVSAGAGLVVKLLQGVGDSPLGSKIYLNPTYAAITTHIPETPVVLGGSAYGTQITASVLGINANVQKTAYQALSASGTDGDVVTNSTVGVSLPNIIDTGVITTTVRGTATNRSGDAQTTAAVANLNLLDGLVKAKVLKAVARTTLASGGHITLRHTSTLVGLRLGGQRIPVSVDPNTRIDVAGLGTVILNQHQNFGFGTTVIAARIIVSTAGLGLPVGASVVIGYASSYILG